MPAAGGRAGRSVAAAAVLATFLICGGCSDTKINDVVIKIFEPRKTPQQNLVAAFASEDPDVRRASLGKVAKSKLYKEDWAIKGYIAIALVDTDPQARCVAVRALTKSEDPRAIETALKLLNYRDYPTDEVRPPDPLTRADATLCLAQLSSKGLVPPEQHDAVQHTLIERLRMDDDVQVRTAAARGLGYYPSMESVRALVGGLNGREFAAVYECEESLVKLTGCTQNCDSLAWEDWIAAHEDDLFAESGQVPETRRLPYTNALGKFGHDTQQFIRWLVPGRKEQ